MAPVFGMKYGMIMIMIAIWHDHDLSRGETPYPPATYTESKQCLNRDH